MEQLTLELETPSFFLKSSCSELQTPKNKSDRSLVEGSDRFYL
ncbi:MAG: hypothetical protein V7L29_11180 [Nostoc sp.]